MDPRYITGEVMGLRDPCILAGTSKENNKECIVKKILPDLQTKMRNVCIKIERKLISKMIDMFIVPKDNVQLSLSEEEDGILQKLKKVDSIFDIYKSITNIILLQNINETWAVLMLFYVLPDKFANESYMTSFIKVFREFKKTREFTHGVVGEPPRGKWYNTFDDKTYLELMYKMCNNYADTLTEANFKQFIRKIYISAAFYDTIIKYANRNSGMIENVTANLKFIEDAILAITLDDLFNKYIKIKDELNVPVLPDIELYNYAVLRPNKKKSSVVSALIKKKDAIDQIKNDPNQYVLNKKNVLRGWNIIYIRLFAYLQSEFTALKKTLNPPKDGSQLWSKLNPSNMNLEGFSESMREFIRKCLPGTKFTENGKISPESYITITKQLQSGQILGFKPIGHRLNDTDPTKRRTRP